MMTVARAETLHLTEEIEHQIADSELAPSTQRHHSLARYTTYRVGGPARLLVTVNNQDELELLAAIVTSVGAGSHPSLLVIGRGSNLLVADRGFDGLVIRLGSGLARFEVSDRTVSAGGATLLPVLARATAEAALRGFEWAVGVPGSVGGAVRMNAGGHGADIKESLTDVDIVDLHNGTRRTWQASELCLGYRRSTIQPHQIVTSARFQLREGDAGQARSELSEIVRWRREHQPGGRNAGSVFTNPEGVSAGQLIEDVAAKGFRIGSAEVSTKHANFIQADEGGRAADIVEIMRHLRHRVKQRHGIDLTVETCFAGFDVTELP